MKKQKIKKVYPKYSSSCFESFFGLNLDVPMEMSAEEIKKILLEGSYVTQADIRKTEEMAAARGVSLTTLLLEEGLMSNDLLGQAIAESLGVPYSDLNSASVSPDQVKRIPEEIAKKHRAVVFSENQATVVVATDAPRDESTIFGNCSDICRQDGCDDLFASGRYRVAFHSLQEIAGDAILKAS